MARFQRQVFACFLSTLVCLASAAASCVAQEGDDATPASKDKAAIEKKIASYVEAYNARDAKRLAAHWSPEAVYVSRLSGAGITGREALEKEFASQFEDLKDAKLAVTTESIEFISPNVALERGTAVVTTPGAPPSQSAYRVIHIKRDGKWMIDRETEDEEPAEPPSHYEQLKELEWMIGTWIDQDGGSVIKTQCQWTRNRNFILRAFTASVGDRVAITGVQLVGWDPVRKEIRSWVFDSDGGFAEGTWNKKGDRWTVRTKATLADGGAASSTSILQPMDPDRFTWQQVNRVVDGEILPDLDEVVIVRQ